MLTDTLFFSVPAILLAALSAAAYPVSTPSLDPLKLCYVTVQTGMDAYETESVRVAGRSFTPGSTVDISVDDEVAVSGVPIGPDGILPEGYVSSPYILRGDRVFSLTAAERGRDGRSVTLESLVSPLVVRATPKRARPTKKIRFRGRGFTERASLFAHYIRRGKLRKTVRLKKTTSGACGTFNVKRRQFPFRPGKGTWRVQFDQHRKLTDEGPLFNLSIDVRRRPRTK